MDWKPEVQDHVVADLVQRKKGGNRREGRKQGGREGERERRKEGERQRSGLFC